MELGVTAIPFVLLLNPEGEVVAIHTRGEKALEQTSGTISLILALIAAAGTRSSQQCLDLEVLP